VHLEALVPHVPGLEAVSSVVLSQAEIQIKYEGYIARQTLEVQKQQAHEQTEIPTDLDYAAVSGLSVEVRQKLLAHQPRTLGQAARLSGVTPAAVSLLWIHLKRMRSASGAQSRVA